MPERFELQRLLWDLRHNPDLAAAAKADPEAVLERYELDESERLAVVDGDVAALLALGANPLLVYFGALELGMSRDDYYAAVRAAPSGRA